MIRLGMPKEKVHKALVVCSGPSMRNFDWSCLDGTDVTIFSVNYSLYHLPKADYWYTFDKTVAAHIKPEKPCDYIFSKWRHEEDVDHSQFPNLPDGTYHVRRNAGYVGFNLDGTLPGFDSGFSCINLAVQMGAQYIAVLGYDCNGLKRFYDEEYMPPKDKDTGTRPSLVAVETAAEQCKELGVTIVNGSPESLCKAWPRVQPMEAVLWLESVQ